MTFQSICKKFFKRYLDGYHEISFLGVFLLAKQGLKLLTSIYAVSLFRPFFLRFCFSVKKYALFYPHFYKFMYALTRLSHTGQNFSGKKFCKGVQPGIYTRF